MFKYLQRQLKKKGRKCTPPVYLMLLKGWCKTGKISDETLLLLSSTTGKMKIEYISHEKFHIDAAVLQKTSCPSFIKIRLVMSSKGLRKRFFVEPKSKIEAK